MLNFKALDNAYTDYQRTLIGNAEACSEEIKLITDKFSTMELSDVFHTWQEDGFISVNGHEEEHTFYSGIAWDSAKKKILYWFEDSDDTKVLAGENAKTRASVRPHLQKLVDKAVSLINVQKGWYEKADEYESVLDDPSNFREDDDEESIWKEGPDGQPSHGDIMMTNGIQE